MKGKRPNRRGSLIRPPVSGDSVPQEVDDETSTPSTHEPFTGRVDDVQELRSEEIVTEVPVETTQVVEIESEELILKRRLAEEKRRKRANFLSSVDDFSQNFETLNIEKEQQRRLAEENETSVLTSGLNVNPTIVAQSIASTERDRVAEKPVVNYVPEVEEKIAEKVSDEEGTKKVQAKTSQDFNSLSAGLFSSAGQVPVTQKFDTDEDNSLSVPNKIGGKTSPKNQPTKSRGVEYLDEDSDEEGTGDINNPKISHFLTREERRGLSPQQRVAWKALQTDMNSKRKGLVLYPAVQFDIQ